MLLEIRREKDGFHIVIPRQQYKPGRTPGKDYWEPVVSLTFREN